MLQACRTFLTDRLQGLILPDGFTLPYNTGECGEVKTIFFGDMPRDFLKDNVAAQCLALQDRNKKFGKLIGKKRNADKTAYTLTRRRFTREVLFRCFLWAERYEDLWGENGYTGLVEQFSQAVAEIKVIKAADGSAIRIEPEDATRPWDSASEQDRKLRRPELAIVRVRFIGGVQTTTTQPLIPSVTINPHVG